ncbi:alpha/beta hydrolase [Actinokineospora sp.]|uniref:alpha/beta hydrolase n=1 Tax=Actinokineospora sp. TaxID=1872133 RepID=UPI00403812EB
MTTLLLIHGGLWEQMDAERFWHQPGVVTGLQQRGFGVLAPNRPVRPSTWTAEVDHLAAALPNQPITVMAGSNGCSPAVRLALTFPHFVARLVLAWPATACDPDIDARARHRLTEQGASPTAINALLAGRTLRGVTDDEISALRTPVGVLPSVPDNPTHQRHTVDALLSLLPQAEELPGCPEPPHPDFHHHATRFLDTITLFAKWSPTPSGRCDV